MEILPEILEYEIGEGAFAFSTTRRGGVSVGAYTAFNITHYCGDDIACVAKNRSLLAALLGIEERNIVLPRQTHSAECLCIDERFFASSLDEQNELLQGVDAVMTDVKGVCIGVSTADCIPILLYDEKHFVVAAVHAGWRGTVARILEKSIATMMARYDTNPSNIRAVIAPGISLEAFEVGDEVYAAFSDAGFPMQQIARLYGKRWHIDLWEANRLQLISCGVAAESIAVRGICTFTNCDDFFSARRLGINSGRIFNGIMLK
ncbi:MAG: peptidoglycan editing factor PgeF [Bacteroidaceae bacterium]|nr:peptidoglycan editing factor PgeF [Bacteroidaceae bacterium]